MTDCRRNVCGHEVALYGVPYGDVYEPCWKPMGHDGHHEPEGARPGVSDTRRDDVIRLVRDFTDQPVELQRDVLALRPDLRRRLLRLP